MLHQLASSRLALIVNDAHGGLEILHLGAPTSSPPAAAAANEFAVGAGGLDEASSLLVLPEAAEGFGGVPGISAHRNGIAAMPRMRTVETTTTGAAITVTSIDSATEIAQEITMTLDPSGVLAVKVSITNTADTDLTLDGVVVTIPTPTATELMQLGGRWSDEFHSVRTPWEWGTTVIENRSGRTSHSRFPMLFAGAPGFSEERGEVWAIHLGWSGNAQLRADRLSDGRRVLQAGELFLPGEVVLAPDERYESPPVYVAYSTAGLNGISDAFHEFVRGRDTHPQRPRPIHLNTWEAVYFTHDLDTLSALAQRAAAVGVERFVLDDGWFHRRADDTAALGDWWVDDQKWPDGLHPIVDEVKRLGMEFGLWVEPEMVNPDSDLYRAHPEWVLGDPHHEPVLARNQLVLDLTNDDAYVYIRDALLALLDEYEIAYLKWDMNRDHVAPISAGRAASHRQTHAVYALLAELKAAHPSLEIESCSSGGGRADLGILAETDRVWTSDCNDALDRVRIQRGISYLLPPELMGAHIGPTRSHTTGRTHRLSFRGATALFGHLGIEWNLLDATDQELERLTEILDVHKTHRALLHSGRTVRIDMADPALSALTVIAREREQALVSVTQIATARALATGLIRIPGLDPHTTYDVAPIPFTVRRLGKARRQPAWVTDGAQLTGAQLATIGLSLPILDPETALVLSLAATTS